MKLLEQTPLPLVVAGVAVTAATVYAGKKLLPILLPNEGKFKEGIVFDETQHGGLLVGHVLKNHGVKYVFLFISLLTPHYTIVCQVLIGTILLQVPIYPFWRSYFTYPCWS